jgi:peptide/nickel transport system substrate-binding protein
MAFQHKRISLLATALVVLTLVLIACQPQVQQVEVTRVVQGEPEIVVETRVVEVEGEPQTIEVTRVVETVVEPTAEPVPQGGDVVESTFADINTLNPVLGNDQASSDVYGQLYLALAGLDPETGLVIPAAAESWDISDDGLVYTFHLRDDIMWTDGTPLTANDVIFTFDAINTDEVASALRAGFSSVESWQALDDYTVELTLNQVDCTTLTSIAAGVGIIPAHVYNNDPSQILENPENTAPTVTAGPLKFREWVPDDHVTLEANPDYYLGAPNIDTWTRRVFADQSAEFAGILAGEADIAGRGVGNQFVSVVEGQQATGTPINVEEYVDNGNVFLGINLANPDNPQNGWDDLDGDGAYTPGEPPLEQDPHPILSDHAVREAMAWSIDYTSVIQQVAFGQGVPTVANVWPSIEWAYNSDITPRTQDLEQAQAILDEAGWVDSDGDGVREKDGQPLAFSLMTNAGNETRENIGIVIKDQLDAIGFDITLDYLEFGTVVANLVGQTFDVVIIGFGGGAPEPDDSSQFSFVNDEVGAGFNFVSYYNETVEENLASGKAVAGCAPEDRAVFYKENQEQMFNDIPYIWLFTDLNNAVWWDRVQNYVPNTWNLWYNIEDWHLVP